MQTLFLPAVIILCSFIVSLIGLTTYSLWHDEKKKHRSLLIKPQETDTDTNINERASRIISQAQEEGRRIVAEAELAGIRTIASKKLNTAELEKNYEKDLSSLSIEAVKELTIASGEMKKRYDQFVTESENIIAHHISQNQVRLDNHIEQAIEANNQAFQLFLQSQQHKLDEAFAKQISQVESLVTNYHKKRLQLVDSQIVDLISQTARITLGRSLDFKEHTDIILEALEEAKSSGFLEKHDNTK